MLFLVLFFVVVSIIDEKCNMPQATEIFLQTAIFNVKYIHRKRNKETIINKYKGRTTKK